MRSRSRASWGRPPCTATCRPSRLPCSTAGTASRDHLQRFRSVARSARRTCLGRTNRPRPAPHLPLPKPPSKPRVRPPTAQLLPRFLRLRPGRSCSRPRSGRTRRPPRPPVLLDVASSILLSLSCRTGTSLLRCCCRGINNPFGHVDVPCPSAISPRTPIDL